MSTKGIGRSDRKLTNEETTRLRQLREEVVQERDDILEQGREAFAAHERAMEDTIQSLKLMRESLGISLQEVADRMGMDRATVLRLENSSSNPTFATLYRYAEALGKRLLITLEDERVA